MARTRLGLVAVSLLVGLGVLVSVFSIPPLLRVPLFALVVILVGILLFRFHPIGDTWHEADRFGINPWLLICVVLLGAMALIAFRLTVMQAGR